VRVPFGRAPIDLDVGDGPVEQLEASGLPPAPPLAGLLSRALDAPFGSRPLHERVRAGDRVTVVISDASREEPRAAFLEALRAALPRTRWTVAVATGTHGPAELGALGLRPALIADAAIVNHDGHRRRDLAPLGRTAHGTEVELHRCVLEADLVIATGCIKPHYFAGFGAGIKAIFPGLGGAAGIRHNHLLKQHPDARAGVVVGNPCRDDLDEAVRLLPTPLFLLNGVAGPDHQLHAAVAGDPWRAFAVGAALAAPWFTVRAQPAPLVVASDRLPVTASLYQAAKLAAAVAPLVAAGGKLVLAAECSEGVGPLDVVNEAIFRIGVLPRLRPGVELWLRSALPDSEVRRTLMRPVVDVAALRSPGERVIVVPEASQLICRPVG
jgi:nickel-dependent lactate racemase